MGDEVEVSERIHRLIWRGMGIRSARELAEETGLPPEKILAIKRELLDSVDVLTVQEKRQKLIIDLQDIAQRAQDDYDSAPFEFKSGILNSATSAIKTILVELNRTSKSEETAINELNEMRRREIVRMYVEVVNTSVAEIAEKHDLDEKELFDLFNRHLVESAQSQDMIEMKSNEKM